MKVNLDVGVWSKACHFQLKECKSNEYLNGLKVRPCR
jgi:hypothetical protein